MSNGGGPISGLGKVSMWGHSPARDLVQLMPNDKDSLPSEGEKKIARILLVGQADLRHVLETLRANSTLLQNGQLFLHFYVAEEFLEVVAREILLLCLALQPLHTLGIHEKSLQWLEIFGNSLIRPKTRKTLVELTQKIMNYLVNPSDSDPDIPIDISDLKYRERDDLVEILKHWKSSEEVFNFKHHWTERVRTHLGVRYDVRQNVFDWDYYIRLCGKGPCIIGSNEYKNWRETGIAFADYDSDYSQPNLSMVTGISSTGDVVLHYRGEIVTGPFISFGIEAKDESLFEKENGRNKSTSRDISLHNLNEIFIELAKGPKQSFFQLFKVSFLSPAAFGGPRFFSRFAERQFSSGFFSSTCAQYLLPPITKLFQQNSCLLVEDTMYLLEFRPEQAQLFREKVLELGEKSGLQLISTETPSAYISFQKTTPKPEASSSDSTLLKNLEKSELLEHADLQPSLTDSTSSDEDKECEVSLNQNPLGDGV